MTGLPRPRLPSLSPPLRIAAAGSVAAALAATGLWWLGNQLLPPLIATARAQLEQQLGLLMGHRLQLGPLRHLGLDGLTVGPSRLLPAAQDRSSVQAQALRLSLDPLASLQRRVPVLELRLIGARADLHRNASGQFWVLGSVPAGGEPARLELRIGVQRSGLVLLHHPGSRQPAQRLQISGQVTIVPHQQSLRGRLHLSLPQTPGSLRLGITGQLQHSRWQLQLQPLALSLAALQQSLPARSRLAGRLDGDLRLDLSPERLRCHGALQLRQLRWWQPGLPAALAADHLPLRCRGTQLQLPASPWRLAGWRGRLAAELDLNQRLKLRLWAQPPATPVFGGGSIQAQLQGLWRADGLRQGQLELWSGASRLVAAGQFAARSDLTGWWRLDPRDLPAGRQLPAWLQQQPIGGRFRLQGPLGSPQLAITTQLSGRDPHLGAWRASLHWHRGLLRLERFAAPHLQARAELPLALRPGGGLHSGALNAWIDLRAFPLMRLDAWVGTRLQGQLDARGWLRGSLQAPATDLQLALHSPAAGPLRLRESWRGRLQGDGQTARLALNPMTPGLPGLLQARLDRRWIPTRV